jgi:hypothetical protein
MRARPALRVLVPVALCLLPRLAAAQDPWMSPSVLDGPPVVLEADSVLQFGDPPTGVLTGQSPITGFAFAPGEEEIAFCAPAGTENRSGLWVVTTTLGEPAAPPDQPKLYRVPTGQPRLVWAAPAGATLRGPVWWAPHAGYLLVRSDTGKEEGLIGIDPLTGEAVTALAGKRVTAVAWSPDGKRFAYVVDAGAGAEVWLQTIPLGEPQRLGPGGVDLRWSGVGEAVRWIDPRESGPWAQMSWQDGQGVEQSGHVPPRPEGAMWSPDGRLCAALEGEGRRLVICPADSPAGETVEIPGAHAQQLLGWSPDSRLVVVLADRDLPIAVSVTPEAAIPQYVLTLLEQETGGTKYPRVRAAVAGPPMDIASGPPSWASDGGQLAYVYKRSSAKGTEFVSWIGSGRTMMASGGDDSSEETERLPQAERPLIAVSVRQEHIPPPPEQERSGYDALTVKLLTNVKYIAMALQMYMTDHDALPEADTVDDLRKILDAYLSNPDVFLRPNSDEVVVQYLLPSGLKVSEIQDPSMLPTVLIDYTPQWNIVGFADGHAKVFPKSVDYGLGNVPPPKAE